MKALINYLKDVRSELKKVVWPKKTEVVRLTSVVLTFSAIVSVYLGGLDFAFTKLLETIIK